MSFSGKKFKRVSSENIEQLAGVLNLGDRIASLLLKSEAVFSFTRVDDVTFTFALDSGSHNYSNTFKLGEASDVKRRDGTMVKVTYFLESENVLKQAITHSDGKIVFFRREFQDDTCTMTISVENFDVQAKVYYEVVK